MSKAVDVDPSNWPLFSCLCGMIGSHLEDLLCIHSLRELKGNHRGSLSQNHLSILRMLYEVVAFALCISHEFVVERRSYRLWRKTNAVLSGLVCSFSTRLYSLEESRIRRVSCNAQTSTYSLRSSLFFTSVFRVSLISCRSADRPVPYVQANNLKCWSVCCVYFLV